MATSDNPGSDNSVLMAAVASEPQAVYEALRASMPAVETIESPSGTFGIICHRADIEAALHDPQTFASTEAVDLGNVRPLIPLSIDPPEHRRYRKILDPLFSPRAMAALESSVTELARSLLDNFEGKKDIDFAHEFSVPLPTMAFLALLGLPIEERDRFLAMKDGIIRPAHVLGLPLGSDEVRAHQRRTADSIYAYFERALDERTAEPRDDILTKLLASELTRNEILDTCFLLLIAGLDTVTASLDCFFAHLARNPDTRRRIVSDPSVIPDAVEELLRYESPVMMVPRITTRETVFGGCPLPAGRLITLMLGSANTDGVEDEVRFERPEQRHLAFGGGVHRCLGSHLARLELRVALKEWHRRYPDYSIPDGVTLAYTPGIRSVAHFPLVLGAQDTSDLSEHA